VRWRSSPARALLLLARWGSKRDGAGGGGRGATGVGEAGGVRRPPACHPADVAGVWRPDGSRALTVVGHGACVGVGERAGQARPASAVG
jgi:hypothetical protein